MSVTIPTAMGIVNELIESFYNVECHGVGTPIEHILIMTPVQITIANMHRATTHLNPATFLPEFYG